MDALEPVRQRAVELHHEVVCDGADPLRPDSLVEAAIRSLELEVVFLPPGDPALKGARALFDVQSGTICCEVTADPGVRATLVGHELGHCCVHGGSYACSAEEIDSSRASESSPIGLHRVEDYGPHERREVQANLFAREFLLPRSVARRLYVDERLGATAIASRLGLPLNLVRQQLLDALLLPWPDGGGAQSELKRDAESDPSQERAASHRGSPFQLQAGPGTGKTRTLVRRVLALLDEGVDPAAILVLTFSNRAAGELMERIMASAPTAAPRIWIGTFHAFGLDLVRRYHDRLGLPASPQLFDRSDAIDVLEEVLPTLAVSHYRNLWDPTLVLRDIVGAISRAKDELATPARYRQLASDMLAAATDDTARVAAEKCLEIAHVYEVYERELNARGGVDFGDLVMRPTLLLEDNEDVRIAVQLRHRHILVDEYQDVNRASTRLLTAVAGDGKRLWVVGDTRQSIYRFRGAASTNMAAFQTQYQQAAVDQLAVNYRSTRAVVEAFSAAAAKMGASRGMLPLALNPIRTDGARPEVRRFASADDEVGGIAAAVRELEAEGVALKDQAVLCRSNGKLNEVAAGLEARGIPVLHLGSLFERSDVRDLLALLSLAVDSYATGLARVGAMRRYDLAYQDIYLAARWIREHEHPPLKGIAALARSDTLSAEGQRALAKLAADLNGLSGFESAWEFLTTYLLDRTEQLRELACSDSVAERMRGIATWQFLNFVREQTRADGGNRIQRTLDRVRRLVLLAEERDLRRVPDAALHMDAVRLMSVHASKGLEFEAVHIPGLTAGVFPSNNRGEICPPPTGMVADATGMRRDEYTRRCHDDEEQCLFFVALSRARTHLRLYLSKSTPTGKARAPSAFLDWLSPGLTREGPATTIAPFPGSESSSRVLVSYPATWDITDTQLKSFDRCPRRYFYTHVLGLGGAKTSTAYARTHACLSKLIQWANSARQTRACTVADAEAAFEDIWQREGPVGHAYAADYRRIASQLIAALLRATDGGRTLPEERFAVDLPNGRIVVVPDEVAERADGSLVLRRIRTGRRRSDEHDRLEYALYQLAAMEHAGGRALVEVVHLANDTAEGIDISARKLTNRRETANKHLSEIVAGAFSPAPDATTCPRCPHFFVCQATPKGSLALS